MKNKIIIALSLITQFSFAQLQNNTWYFSPTNKGIQFDFNTNVPTVITAHTPLTSLHGCGVAADPASGAIKIYTDGQFVYDAGNFQMPNGGALNGGVSCAEKGMIVQVPNSCDSFYVFSNNADSPNQGSIYYSIVNTSLPGNGSIGQPKGDVEIASLNTLVMDSSTESYAIAPHFGGGNYWLIVPVNNSANINVYSITRTGITFSSTFNTGTVFNSSMSIKYSKLAGKVAYTSVIENDPAIIMDFNSSSGTLSNATIITGTPVGSCLNLYNGWHDLEFSPDGTKLYLSKYRMYSPASAGRIYQYDLNFPSSPLTVVFNNPSTDIYKVVTGMQTGPDGKIYFIYYNTTTNDDRLIGCINSPNLAGILCNVSAAALDLGIAQNGNSRFSKPAFFNRDIFPIITINPCSGEGVNELVNNNNIDIFPNPSAGNININLSKLNKTLSLEVFDEIGKLVYKTELNKMSSVLDFNFLDNGVYIFKFSDKESTEVKRLVVER